jgi:hypothetical protein
MLPTVPRSKFGDALPNLSAAECAGDEVDQNLFHYRSPVGLTGRRLSPLPESLFILPEQLAGFVVDEMSMKGKSRSRSARRRAPPIAGSARPGPLPAMGRAALQYAAKGQTDSCAATNSGHQNSLSVVQLVEQYLRLLQIERVEAFRKPAVNRREQFASLLRLPLIAPEPRHAYGRP